MSTTTLQAERPTAPDQPPGGSPGYSEGDPLGVPGQRVIPQDNLPPPPRPIFLPETARFFGGVPDAPHAPRRNPSTARSPAVLHNGLHFSHMALHAARESGIIDKLVHNVIKEQPPSDYRARHLHREPGHQPDAVPLARVIASGGAYREPAWLTDEDARYDGDAGFDPITGIGVVVAAPASNGESGATSDGASATTRGFMRAAAAMEPTTHLRLQGAANAADTVYHGLLTARGERSITPEGAPVAISGFHIDTARAQLTYMSDEGTSLFVVTPDGTCRALPPCQEDTEKVIDLEDGHHLVIGVSGDTDKETARLIEEAVWRFTNDPGNTDPNDTAALANAIIDFVNTEAPSSDGLQAVLATAISVGASDMVTVPAELPADGHTQTAPDNQDSSTPVAYIPQPRAPGSGGAAEAPPSKHRRRLAAGLAAAALAASALAYPFIPGPRPPAKKIGAAIEQVLPDIPSIHTARRKVLPHASAPLPSPSATKPSGQSHTTKSEAPLATPTADYTYANRRTALADNPGTHNADNVTQFSRDALQFYGQAYGLPQHELAALVDNTQVLIDVNLAFFNDNIVVANDEHHFLNAGAAYNTAQQNAAAKKAVFAVMQRLGRPLPIEPAPAAKNAPSSPRLADDAAEVNQQPVSGTFPITATPQVPHQRAHSPENHIPWTPITAGLGAIAVVVAAGATGRAMHRRTLRAKGNKMLTELSTPPGVVRSHGGHTANRTIKALKATTGNLPTVNMLDMDARKHRVWFPWFRPKKRTQVNPEFDMYRNKRNAKKRPPEPAQADTGELEVPLPV